MRRPTLPITLITLVVSLVGLADAARGGIWDLFLVFLILVAIHGFVLMSAQGNRSPVTLRADLARWANQRSQQTGEPVNDVVDRAVAWFQQDLYGAGHHNDNDR